jgi:hypothetical protein
VRCRLRRAAWLRARRRGRAIGGPDGGPLCPSLPCAYAWGSNSNHRLVRLAAACRRHAGRPLARSTLCARAVRPRGCLLTAGVPARHRQPLWARRTMWRRACARCPGRAWRGAGGGGGGRSPRGRAVPLGFERRAGASSKRAPSHTKPLFRRRSAPRLFTRLQCAPWRSNPSLRSAPAPWGLLASAGRFLPSESRCVACCACRRRKRHQLGAPDAWLQRARAPRKHFSRRARPPTAERA